jgi:hypothetical protein
LARDFVIMTKGLANPALGLNSCGLSALDTPGQLTLVFSPFLVLVLLKWQPLMVTLWRATRLVGVTNLK